ncbi:MAG: hypothetical protein AAGE94_11000, partial [Acidobacteriota bacterium]
DNTAVADFDFFEGTATESTSRARITVRRGGLMVITKAAVDLLGDEVEHVQLAYSAKTGSVGIRATTEDASGGYLLRTQTKSPSRLVGGKRFFQHHGLDIDKARTYDAEDFGHGIVGFRLNGSADDADEAKPARKSRPRHKSKATS